MKGSRGQGRGFGTDQQAAQEPAVNRWRDTLQHRPGAGLKKAVSQALLGGAADASEKGLSGHRFGKQAVGSLGARFDRSAKEAMAGEHIEQLTRHIGIETSQ